MKSLALILAVVGSSVLLAEAFTPDVHDPSYRKTTSFIEKGDYLESPQHGSSAIHKHPEKAPHHDDSHSHEDSSEHRRHARDTEDSGEVGTRRLGGGSYSHGRRPGSSGLGSGSFHSGSSGLGHSSHGSGLGSGSLHTGSGYGHSSHGSGLGSGSHRPGSSGLGHSSHGSGLGSGSYRPGSGHHSSGLGSGSHHSGSFYQGTSGLVSGTLLHGTISFNDKFIKMRKRSADQNSPTISIEGNNVQLTNDEHSCLYSNVRDEVIENRKLECNGESCSLLEQSNRHTAWQCGQLKCNILKFDIDKALPSGLIFQCTERRSLITAPQRCPSGSRIGWGGKCRTKF